MNVESIREHCLSMPHATEIMQWGDHVLFKVGGKMFCILSLEESSLSLKCTPESYAEMVERPDVVPSSHNMWRHQWITLETLNAVYDSELRGLIATSYRLVYDKLPKKTRTELETGGPSTRSTRTKQKPGKRVGARS